MKILLTLFLTLCFLGNSYAKTISGKVFNAGKGLSGVVVTDGKYFTVTDSKGVYSLKVSKDAEHIYIVTPSGYIPACKGGTPLFYRDLNGSDFEFELYEFGVPGGSYRLLAVGDPQPKGDNAFYRLEHEAFADLREMGKKCRAKNLPVFSIFLGDILYDNLNLYPHIQEMMHNIQMPVWPVIGNHDHDMNVTEDLASSREYSNHFGPTYYAFNAGKDYYIVLDNILYNGIENYKEGLDSRQINWVKDYLKYVPKESHIFVAMHAPVFFYRWKDYKMVMADEFIDLFKDYKVTVISGHTHIQYNYEINENMREFNIASVGGAWWVWDIMYSRDGTPCGYQVFDSNHKGITNFWKSTGKPEDYQMKVYPVGTVKGHLNDICVKVWNWDNRWKVEWYEDNEYRGDMKQYSGKDPDYHTALQMGYALNGGKGAVSAIPDSYFYFSATPSGNAGVVKIVVTDASGKKYTEEIDLK